MSQFSDTNWKLDIRFSILDTILLLPFENRTSAASGFGMVGFPLLLYNPVLQTFGKNSQAWASTGFLQGRERSNIFGLIKKQLKPDLIGTQAPEKTPNSANFKNLRGLGASAPGWQPPGMPMFPQKLQEAVCKILHLVRQKMLVQRAKREQKSVRVCCQKFSRKFDEAAL